MPTLIFKKNDYFLPKIGKNRQNSDHNIDPRKQWLGKGRLTTDKRPLNEIQRSLLVPWKH
jgi:hypothetical protein